MSRPLPSSVHDALWPADQLSRPVHRTCPTGFAALDLELPGGGWPTRGLTELLMKSPQASWPLAEWSLLLPGLQAALRGDQALLLIGPPLLPHAPGLLQAGVPPASVVWVQASSPQERLWAAEQVIRGPGAARDLGALVAWLPKASSAQIRRLQTWALPCDAPLFLVRPAHAAREPSAAPLRLEVTLEAPGRLGVHLLKRRGPVHAHPLQLDACPWGLGDLPLRRPASQPSRTQAPQPIPQITALQSQESTPASSQEQTHALDLPGPMH